MRIAYFITLLVCTHSVATAQYANQTVYPPLDELTRRDGRVLESNAHPQTRFVNAQYRYPVPYWTHGVLRPYVGTPSRPWLLYDALQQKLLTRASAAATDSVVVNTDEIREFSVGDSLLGSLRRYRRYLDARLSDPALGTAFFEVRQPAGAVGGSALLCRRTVRQRHPGTAPRPWQRLAPKTVVYEEQVRYYVYDRQTNTIVWTALDYTPLLTALRPAQQPALATYIRQEGLKLNREADVAKLLAYYDTL